MAICISDEEESSNSGAIAGAVIGSLLASVVIVVGLVYVFRHRLGAFFKGNGPQHNKRFGGLKPRNCVYLLTYPMRWVDACEACKVNTRQIGLFCESHNCIE